MIIDSQQRFPARHGLARVLAAAAALLAAAAMAQPTVVVSIAPYADLVERLAGPGATVSTLLPIGASPHSFDPSPRDLTRLEGADLVVVNGGLDTWVLDLVDAAGPEVPVFEALAAVDPDRVAPAAAHEDHEDHEAEAVHGGEADAAPDAEAAAGGHQHGEVGGINAHVWLDPLLVVDLVPELVAALDAVDPTGAPARAEAAGRLVSELEALHRELTEILAPVSGAAFVPFHDAWPHFAARYGLDLVLEIEPFPGREPSAREMAEAVQAVRRSGARAIFAEAQLQGRPAEVLAAEANVDVATLDPLGGTGATRRYEDLLRYNARAIAAALAGD